MYEQQIKPIEFHREEKQREENRDYNLPIEFDTRLN